MLASDWSRRLTADWFQIVVNDSPWLRCTTMTHTPAQTTQAGENILKIIPNSCYTGGARFLEAGDRLVLRNSYTDR